MQGSYYNLRLKQAIHVGPHTIHLPIGRSEVTEVGTDGVLVYTLGDVRLKMSFATLHGERFRTVRWNRTIFTRDASRRIDDSIHPGQFRYGEFVLDVTHEGELRWRSPNDVLCKRSFSYSPQGYRSWTVYLPDREASLLFKINTVHCDGLFDEDTHLILTRTKYTKSSNRPSVSSSSSSSSTPTSSSQTRSSRARRAKHEYHTNQVTITTFMLLGLPLVVMFVLLCISWAKKYTCPTDF